MKQVPAHAGSLRVSERLAFVLVFTVMAMFVVGLSVLAAKSALPHGTGRPLAAAGPKAPRAQQGNAHKPGGTGDATAGPAAGNWHAQPSAVLSKRLTEALSAALATSRAHLSVGVIDPATGAEALYQASERYHAAGIAQADILAVLLYQHRHAHTPISNENSSLAAAMIGNSSGTAALRLWRAIGRGAGLAAANRALGLRQTIPGTADSWRLTKTTVADQLQLLTDLAKSPSALDSVSRHYELSLMASAANAQRWGAPAAVGGDTSYAVNDAWQTRAHRFVVSSIGVVEHGGHEFLVVILSRGWRSRAAGISAVQAAAIAAVGAMPASS